jgi:hypothetical protein
MKDAPDYAKHDVNSGNSGPHHNPKDQKARMGRDVRENCETFPGHYIPAEFEKTEN